MMTKSEREREREREIKSEKERETERERERKRIPRERYINKRSKLNIQTITLTYLTTAFPAGTICHGAPCTAQTQFGKQRC